MGPGEGVTLGEWSECWQGLRGRDRVGPPSHPFTDRRPPALPSLLVPTQDPPASAPEPRLRRVEQAAERRETTMSFPGKKSVPRTTVSPSAATGLARPLGLRLGLALLPPDPRGSQTPLQGPPEPRRRRPGQRLGLCRPEPNESGRYYCR